MHNEPNPSAQPAVEESDFADVAATETVWLPGGTRFVEIRKELTAQETYTVLDLLRGPYSRERDIAIALIFVDGWNLRGHEGQPVKVDAEALRNMKPERREVIEKVIDERVDAYLKKVFPPELRKKDGSGAPDDPQQADAAAGDEPLPVSA